MSEPEPSALCRDYLRDLATDIRCARLRKMPAYEAEVSACFRALWAARHRAQIDRWGVPFAPSETGER